MILNPILGLTWIFGVLSVDKKLVVFQYIFAIVNSLQVSQAILNRNVHLHVYGNILTFESKYIRNIIIILQGLFIFLLHGVCLKKSLSTQTKKLKDGKRLPEKFSSSSSSKARIPVQDKSKLKSDEYYILNNGASSETSTYKPSNISSYSFSTDVTNFSEDKY